MDLKERMEWRRIINIMNNQKFIIIFIILMSIFAGYVYSYQIKVPKYESTATIILGKENVSQSQEDAISQTEVNLNKSLVATYTNIVKSKTVLRAVLEELSLQRTEQELASQIQVSQVKDTQIIKISVIDEKSIVAKQIAGSITEHFIEQVKQIYHIDNMEMIDKPELADSACNLNHKKDVIIAMGIGILFVIITISIFYFLDNTIKEEKDIEEFIKIPILGSIPKSRKKKELIVQEDLKSPVAEAFRTTRTNITYTKQEEKVKTILVTSTVSGEGKSWITSNLAIAFAQANQKVLLIDTDMRKGRQHNIFETTYKKGLSDCIIKTEEPIEKNVVQIADYIQQTQIPNIHIMTNGTVPPNPSELISSKKMKKLIGILREIYDIILLDGTPCMLVADSIALSTIADKTILVAESRKTKIDSMLKIKKQVENVDGSVAGVIFNKKKMANKVYKNKYYYGTDEKLEIAEESLGNYKSVEDLFAEVKNKNWNEIIEEKKEVVQKETNQNEMEIENLKLQIETLKEEMKTFIEEKREEEKIVTTEKTIDYLKAIRELEKKVNQMETTQKPMEKINESLEKVVDCLKMKITEDIQLQEEIKFLEESANKFSNKEEIENLQKQLKQQDNKYKEEIEKLIQTMEQLDIRYITNQERIQKSIEEKEDNSYKELTQIMERLEKQENENAQETEKIMQYIEEQKQNDMLEVESVRINLKEQKKEYDEQIEKILENFEKQEKSYSAEIEKLMQESQKQQEKQKDNDEKINRLYEELEKLKIQKEEVEEKIDNKKVVNFQEYKEKGWIHKKPKDILGKDFCYEDLEKTATYVHYF